MELVNDGRNDFRKFFEKIQNATIKFSMYDVKNNVKIIANSPAEIELKCESCGIGGDELYDDYQPDKTVHGRVGKVNGSWPSDLRTVYPWHNYEGTRMAKQLHRSDTVCGHHGIEARYPLADQRVFQQWLNTTVKLKNSGYKHWMTEYLREHDYPYTTNKTGFTSKRDRIR